MVLQLTLQLQLPISIVLIFFKCIFNCYAFQLYGPIIILQKSYFVSQRIFVSMALLINSAKHEDMNERAECNKVSIVRYRTRWPHMGTSWNYPLQFYSLLGRLDYYEKLLLDLAKSHLVMTIVPSTLMPYQELCRNKSEMNHAFTRSLAD